ncbi:201_t:CDS:2 [Diversispora eburnea]|uniref:201_t:CDS:1 n=1 Tax=Diversispora eburnea TaxID=1213867 RepID=A0A9N8W931_9GLOM|nr:201_t:CDS:2 [Diversispora eburnea]
MTNTSKTPKHKKDQSTTKIRARTSRVKERKNLNASCEKQSFRNCIRCKESSNSVKFLSERIDRIEQLVSTLKKTTQNFSKRDNSTRTTWKIRNLDTSKCSLEELQKLVIQTTNLLLPQKNASDLIDPTTKTTPITVLSTDNLIHAEPLQDNSQGACEMVTKTSSNSTRKDSGFCESK